MIDFVGTSRRIWRVSLDDWAPGPLKPAFPDDFPLRPPSDDEYLARLARPLEMAVMDLAVAARNRSNHGSPLARLKRAERLYPALISMLRVMARATQARSEKDSEYAELKQLAEWLKDDQDAITATIRAFDDP